jgi:hypothetical protein
MMHKNPQFGEVLIYFIRSQNISSSYKTFTLLHNLFSFMIFHLFLWFFIYDFCVTQFSARNEKSPR